MLKVYEVLSCILLVICFFASFMVSKEIFIILLGIMALSGLGIAVYGVFNKR